MRDDEVDSLHTGLNDRLHSCQQAAVLITLAPGRKGLGRLREEGLAQELRERRV
jgi:hypothetical protein